MNNTIQDIFLWDLVTVFISPTGKNPVWKQDSSEGKVSYLYQGSLSSPAFQPSPEISARWREPARGKRNRLGVSCCFFWSHECNSWHLQQGLAGLRAEAPLKILLRLKALITATFTPVSNSVQMSPSRALSGMLRMRLCRIGLKQWVLKRNILLVVLLSLTTSNETPWQFWENEFALKTHSSYKQCINYFINLLFLHYGKHSSIYIFLSTHKLDR